MYTCSGSSIQERSAGFPMFSFDLLITCCLAQPRNCPMTPVATAMFSFALMDAMFGIPEWKGHV